MEQGTSCKLRLFWANIYIKKKKFSTKSCKIVKNDLFYILPQTNTEIASA